VPRRDGRQFVTAIDRQVRVPVLQLHGEADPLVLTQTARDSRSRVAAPYCWHSVPAAGHFLPDEAPDAVDAALLPWLATLPATA
jgi:pimeloyl-ACP methyl ester carboxylesterase